MYGQSTYGSEAYGDTQAVVASEVIEPSLLTNAFQIFAPTIHGDATLAVPLISNAFQVFAPESVAARGRPLAEDIRIMRVSRDE